MCVGTDQASIIPYSAELSIPTRHKTGRKTQVSLSQTHFDHVKSEDTKIPMTVHEEGLKAAGTGGENKS